MKEYEDFVRDQFRAQRTSGRPGEVFQNRNTDHAKVVMPWIFSGAEKWVHLLSRKVDPKVYGSDRVLNAAVEFLDSHPSAEVVFLSEERFERSNHPYFQKIDQDEERAKRVTLEFVPDAVKRGYSCNFAVNDQSDFRFEASRNTQEAMVQFGGIDFAPDLERTFTSLRSAASK